MKRNQKLSIGGVQALLFPMEVMNITQGNNEGTHLGTNALDNAGKDTGIDPTFAPCDMRLVAYDSYANGNAVFFESLNKVYFRDGTIDYATFMFIHDNAIADILAYAAKGHTWKQGEEFGDEGTAGKATGNHVHMEVAKGRYTHMYNKNGYGVYYLPRNVSADLAFFTDGTTIKANRGFKNWAASSIVKKPTATQTKKSDAVIADEVIAGKWGTGSDRKTRLTNAGYDYNAVQKLVNEKLSSKKSISTIASEVIAGKWGNGADRRAKLQKAGYDPDAVQKEVNKRMR